MVAPFWRDLDPSKGGTIKYGDSGFAFVVAWINVPNKVNSNTQTFAIYFYPGFGGNEDIQFLYKSITNDVSTSIGIEDQCGKRGPSVSSVSSGQRVIFVPDMPDNFYRIDKIKVSASKLTDNGTNDNDAIIHLDGLDNLLPGGINVELEDPSEGVYQSFPIVSAATFALGTVALATGYGFIGVVGYVISGAHLVYQLSPMPSSTIHEADRDTQTAYVLALSLDENRPNIAPWDVSILLLTRWRLLSRAVTHRLVITTEVTYERPDGSKYTLTTDSLELKLLPSVDLTVLAEDQYGNSLTAGDVYIDGKFRGLTGSTFGVATGNHSIFVCDSWEQYGRVKHSFDHWENGLTSPERNITVTEDMTIIAHLNETSYYDGTCCPADITGDGYVNVWDLGILVEWWGHGC